MRVVVDPGNEAFRSIAKSKNSEGAKNGYVATRGGLPKDIGISIDGADRQFSLQATGNGFLAYPCPGFMMILR